MLEKLLIGHIVNTHGVKGDLRVVPLTDDVKRFEGMESIKIERNDKPVGTYPIERVWYHKGFVLLKLKGVDDMTQAEKLKDSFITITREEAIELPEDTYFIGDLVGLAVVADDGEDLGVITKVIQTGSNDVFEVRKEGAKKPLLIPFIQSCVLDVNLQDKKVLVHLLEGLRDL